MKSGIVYLIIAFFLLIISFLKDREKTLKSLKISFRIALKTIPILFFIFVLMGALQALISKETFISFLSSGNSFFSIVIAGLTGCFALIQPAAVFPFSGFLLDNGAGFGVLAAFISTSILIGISTLPLEIQIFGKKFTVARNLLTFIIVIIMSVLMGKIL